jgi:hypothetical protein
LRDMTTGVLLLMQEPENNCWSDFLVKIEEGL